MNERDPVRDISSIADTGGIIHDIKVSPVLIIGFKVVDTCQNEICRPVLTYIEFLRRLIDDVCQLFLGYDKIVPVLRNNRQNYRTYRVLDLRERPKLGKESSCDVLRIDAAFLFRRRMSDGLSRVPVQKD